jgi:hypothetical protein
MKLIESNEPKDNPFTPFRITFEFETATEARLMWHIFNRLDLFLAMRCEERGGGTYGTIYNQPVDNEFGDYITRERIRKYIEKYIGVVK